MPKANNDRIVTFRTNTDDWEAFSDLCERNGLKASSYLRDVIKSAINADTLNANQLGAEKASNELMSRLDALEAKITAFEKGRKPIIKVDASTLDDKDLITMDEMEALTGYTKSTLSPKLSRLGIQAVKRIQGNRGGLYDKAEILREVGTNPLKY